MSLIPLDAYLKNAKSILFNSEMANATSKDTKTCTRRIATIREVSEPYNVVPCDEINLKLVKFHDNGIVDFSYGTINQNSARAKAKYLKGDILYVRETFLFGKIESGFEAEYGVPDTEYVIYNDTDGAPIYRADHLNYDISSLDKDEIPKWTPSIHMPKKEARIFLRVVGVRVERLKDITQDGIKAEGFNKDLSTCAIDGYSQETVARHVLFAWWINLWDSTSKSGYLWSDNPFVFVYAFERIK